MDSYGYNTTDNTPKPSLAYPNGSGPVNNVERNAGHAGPNTPNSKSSTTNILEDIVRALEGLIKDIFVPVSNQDRAGASARITDPLRLNSQLTPPAGVQFNIPNDPELRRSVGFNDEFGDVKFVSILRNARDLSGQGGGIGLGSGGFTGRQVFSNKAPITPPIRKVPPTASISGSSIIATAQAGAGGTTPSTPSAPAGTAPAGGGSTPSAPSSPSAPAPTAPAPSRTYTPPSTSGRISLRTTF